MKIVSTASFPFISQKWFSEQKMISFGDSSFSFLTISKPHRQIAEIVSKSL